MNLTSKNPTIQSNLPVLVDHLTSWASANLGVTPNFEGIEVRDSRDGRGASVQIPVTSKDRLLNHFLSEMYLSFYVDLGDQGGVVAWRVTFNFSHKDGGSNGWSEPHRLVVLADNGVIL